ncbi:MAG: hypothetical protein OEV76_07955, partial [Anaerolineae bacterium]|nr:hypothetical protein [Anaerolineae bacterium]
TVEQTLAYLGADSPRGRIIGACFQPPVASGKGPTLTPALGLPADGLGRSVKDSQGKGEPGTGRYSV